VMRNFFSSLGRIYIGHAVYEISASTIDSPRSRYVISLRRREARNRGTTTTTKAAKTTKTTKTTTTTATTEHREECDATDESGIAVDKTETISPLLVAFSLSASGELATETLGSPLPVRLVSRPRLPVRF